MRSRCWPALLVLPLLAAGCSGSSGSGGGGATSAPTPVITAPAPGVTLPPDALSRLVPLPAEVPAGMVLVVKGSGPRDLQTVAGYSGSGASASAAVAAAAAKLRAHGFQRAYVAQYVNATSGAVLSVLASTYATAAGATADFTDDAAATSGAKTSVPPVGEASSATVTTVQGSVRQQLLLLRFRQGVVTWSLAYQAAPTADPGVAVALARKLVARV